MKELEIIELALENIPKDLPVKGKWTEFTRARELDGEIKWTIDKNPVRYNVEIKQDLRGHQLKQIIDMNKKHQPFMLVAAHLFPKIKAELRENNIAYLEANGNLFLKHQGTILFIENNKPLVPEKKTGNRAFTKTGLKVVFEFLRNENWLNQTYQAIAAQTGTTAGNIYKIITGLEQDGFLLPVTKNEYKLNNKKQLLEKWMAAYEEKLKPALNIGTFRFLKKDDFTHWKKIQLQPGKTVWGGEPAGELLTNYLQPEELTLYTDETRNELIKNYRLIPDTTGNIKVYQKFWRRDDTDTGTTDPLLAYADLMNTNDRRCIETAQKIYDAHLQNKL